LLNLLRQGNWEAIADQQTALLPALEAVRNPALAREKAISPVQLASLQEKLQQAIGECRERQAQIAPLVEAFTKNRPPQSSS
jgi:hypothetical protein